MPARSLRSRLAPYLLVGLCFALLLALFEYALQLRETLQQSRQQEMLHDQAARLRMQLESEINAAAFLATGVESYVVAREGQVNSDEVQRILALVFERGRHFRNIGIAPDNRIRWVFPLAGNEAAVGFDYTEHPQQWADVQRVMLSTRGILSGPLELVQGGRGLVYRAPIRIGGEYWGLLTTVIDADSLFALLPAPDRPDALRVALRHASGADGPGAVFYGDPALFQRDQQPLLLSLPGEADWEMAYALPAPSSSAFWMIRAGGYLLCLLLAMLAALGLRLWWQRNLLRRLETLVEQRSGELADTNELLSSVLASARAFAIVAVDLDGIIRVFNAGAERMLGYAADEVIGKRPVTLFLLGDELRQRARQLAEELGRELQGDEVFTLRVRQGIEEVLQLHYRHRDGRLIPVQVVVSAIRDQHGEVTGYLGIAEDISERQRNQTLKDQFISTVSHELRTPLTAISGALRLLQSGTLGEVPQAMQSMLAIASNNSQRLGLLINDLLDIEKLMAGRMAFDLQPVSPEQVAQTVVHDLQQLAASRTVSLDLRSQSMPAIRVDALRLQQILTNLVGNAIKFSDAGGRVAIGFVEAGEWLRIVIEDQGPGIDPAFHERIFQRFAQADGSDQRRAQGTGLGLAISKELTEQMGGRIGFVSTPGQGSLFWVEFPGCRTEG